MLISEGGEPYHTGDTNMTNSTNYNLDKSKHKAEYDAVKAGATVSVNIAWVGELIVTANAYQSNDGYTYEVIQDSLYGEVLLRWNSKFDFPNILQNRYLDSPEHVTARAQRDKEAQEEADRQAEESEWFLNHPSS